MSRQRGDTGLATTVVHAVCPHDCYDTCGLTVRTEDDRIVSIEGDKGHPITQGFLCFKVNRYQDRLYHKDRIATPLKRVGPKGSGEFLEVSWNEALEEVGDRLRTIVKEFGGEAVLPYSFSGNMGILSEASLDRRFFHAIGASRLDRTICTAAADYALRYVYGARLGPDPETIVDTRCVVLWGSNPMATNIHEIPLLDTARAAGARIVTIDPLETATARRYDQHVAVKPESDYVLALGLGQAILARKAHDTDFIDRYVKGFAAYAALVRPYGRDVVLERTGLSGAVFDDLVDLLISSRPLLFRTGYGVQRQQDGAKTIWAISALSLILGTPQEIGGGHLCGNGDAFGIRWDRLSSPQLLERPTRIINMVQLGEALVNPMTPPIKALIVYNSNPAVTAPDQTRVLRGLSRQDLLTIVHEQMLTDTAKYADFVFPAAMSMEILDLHTSYWHRYIQLSAPATAPWRESVSNTEFFRRLASAVGLNHPALFASDETLIEEAIDENHPWMTGISLESLTKDPVKKVGLRRDMRPFMDTPIPTSDGFFHIQPLPINPEPHPVLTLLDDEFHLISSSRRETIKSSFGNIARVLKSPHQELLMHPDDMARLHLSAQDRVRVFNESGHTTMLVQPSLVARPGVVVSYAVQWNGEGTNVNQLTTSTLSDAGGGGTFYSTRVRVSHDKA